jgi:DNA-binding GntR family transcriptional regulator
LTDGDIANLKRIHSEFRSALDQQQYRVCFARDREFHDELMRLCDNSKLREFYDRLGATIQVTRWMHCEDHAHQESSYQQHGHILDALERRAVDDACASMRDHVEKVKADLLDHHQAT